jgi:2-iminobutanoate/2-iminopropanoate deaminase
MLKCFNPEDAPKALGPYSHIVKAGSLVFISGQLPLDPTTNKLIAEDIEAQTKQVINNLETLLKSQNLSFNDVCRCDIFLKNLQDFQKVNTVYGQAFSHHKPARQTVEVSALPMGALIEISCIAYCKD